MQVTTKSQEDTKIPAVSQSQSNFFKMVRATQEGKLKNPSKHLKQVAAGISAKDAHDFAATPSKGLPERTEKKAFEHAFTKQAQAYGFDEKDAKSLLKSALE